MKEVDTIMFPYISQQVSFIVDTCNLIFYKLNHLSLICSVHFTLKNFFLAFNICRFYVVIRFISSLPQRPMTSDFEGFSVLHFIHYIYFLILILEKEPVFPFSMFSAKRGNYWYHFYNVFGMTRSLTGD